MPFQINSFDEHVHSFFNRDSSSNVLIQFSESFAWTSGRIFRDVSLNIGWVDLRDTDAVVTYFLPESFREAIHSKLRSTVKSADGNTH